MHIEESLNYLPLPASNTGSIFSSLEDQVFMHIKTVPPQLSLASQNWAAGILPPAKATDIHKSHRVQLHATEKLHNPRQLGSQVQGSHAGWAPNSSVNTAQCFTTKEDGLKFRGICTPVHLLVIKKKISLYSQAAHCISPRVCVRTIRSSGAQTKLNGLQGHIVEWSCRCLKWVDGEHVGQPPSPGVIVTLKEATGRIR